MESYETKKKEAMKKSSDHENVVVLSLVIEASIEASFQESVAKIFISIVTLNTNSFLFFSFSSRPSSFSPRS